MKLPILSAVTMLSLTACASVSDIERLQASIDSVQATADSALSVADGAQSTANEAVDLANEANTTANRAQDTADDAQYVAENARKGVYGLTEDLITSLQRFRKQADTSDEDDRTLRLR